MEKLKDAVVWAEIPVLNFDRAKAFYSKIYDYDMYEQMMGHHRMGFLPMDPDARGVGGAIVQGQGYTPSALGSKVYLNAGNDLSLVLNRVSLAGGKVIQPKTKITDEIGYYAVFEDTEGNHVCLHSMN
ncbi:VOC family protein [Sunxiuqinia rutila]|uniref:VOC family protein n=1 Tax=Sunxiuqinia rutila TaxID=1397841 RepID=UPI003D3693BF